MVKVQRTSEQIQHFLEEIQDQFWGDLVQHTRVAVKQFLDLWSERERDAFIGLARYQRYEQGGDQRPEYRNGYYERDWVTRFGTMSFGSRGPVGRHSSLKASGASREERMRSCCLFGRRSCEASALAR